MSMEGQDRLNAHLLECEPCKSSYDRLGSLIHEAANQRKGYKYMAEALLPLVVEHPDEFTHLRSLECFVEEYFSKAANQRLREETTSKVETEASFAAALAAVGWIASGKLDERRFGYWLLDQGYIRLTDVETGRDITYRDEREMPRLDISLVTLTAKAYNLVKQGPTQDNPLLPCVENPLKQYLG